MHCWQHCTYHLFHTRAQKCDLLLWFTINEKAWTSNLRFNIISNAKYKFFSLHPLYLNSLEIITNCESYLRRNAELWCKLCKWHNWWCDAKFTKYSWTHFFYVLFVLRNLFEYDTFNTKWTNWIKQWVKSIKSVLIQFLWLESIFELIWNMKW